MKKISMTLFVTIACIGMAGAAPTGQRAAAVKASELAWTEMPGTGGVQTAPLWGEMSRGAHAMMVKFPAASVHPLHTHSSRIKMVVVSGTLTYGPEGGPQVSYGPGSYIDIPGGARHTSGCTAAAPCILFHEASGKFDMHLVGRAP